MFGSRDAPHPAPRWLCAAPRFRGPRAWMGGRRQARAVTARRGRRDEPPASASWTGVVAFASQQRQLWAAHAQLDRMVRAALFIVTRNVGQRVLIARLLRGAGIQGLEVRLLGGVKIIAPGCIGIFQQ